MDVSAVAWFDSTKVVTGLDIKATHALFGEHRGERLERHPAGDRLGRHGHGDPDRHVDGEDPLPVHAGHEQAADERRGPLVDLARRYGFLLVEDVAYRELAFDGESLPSLWSLGPDIVRGQAGFKLTARLDRDDLPAAHQAADAFISQGKRMIKYACALKRRLHGLLG